MFLCSALVMLLDKCLKPSFSVPLEEQSGEKHNALILKLYFFFDINSGKSPLASHLLLEMLFFTCEHLLHHRADAKYGCDGPIAKENRAIKHCSCSCRGRREGVEGAGCSAWCSSPGLCAQSSILHSTVLPVSLPTDRFLHIKKVDVGLFCCLAWAIT